MHEVRRTRDPFSNEGEVLLLFYPELRQASLAVTGWRKVPSITMTSFRYKMLGLRTYQLGTCDRLVTAPLTPVAAAVGKSCEPRQFIPFSLWITDVESRGWS